MILLGSILQFFAKIEQNMWYFGTLTKFMVKLETTHISTKQNDKLAVLRIESHCDVVGCCVPCGQYNLCINLV